MMNKTFLSFKFVGHVTTVEIESRQLSFVTSDPPNSQCVRCKMRS